MNADLDNSSGQLEERLNFETLIAELSSRFINLMPDDVDGEILNAQRLVCQCLRLELSALWQWAEDDPDVLLMTHLYRPLGGPPVPTRMNAQEHWPWALKQVKQGRRIRLDSLEASPPEAVRDREMWVYYGIKNVLVIPLSTGGAPPFGCVSFHSVREAAAWPDAVVKRLELVAQVFSNALARKQTDEALRKSEERLGLAADSAEAGLWELDCRTQTFWATDKAKSIIGADPLETVTLDRFEARVHPDDRERVHRVIQRALTKHDPIRVEYRILRPDGSNRWIASSGRPHDSSNGQVVRLMGVSIDITEHKQTEEALRRSCAEVRQLKDRLQAESDYLKAEMKATQPHGAIVGQGAAIKRMLLQIGQVAPTDSTVLIRGETGTGKELVAEALHRLSPRRAHVLIKVNCAALPSALVESELFGREKGAFTGALTRQIGRFEIADKSTIFLDEVGELSLEVQAKLLRVLQEGRFERLGSPKTLGVDVRVIAATNRDLPEEVRQGRFREDLFYRLNVFPIRVPPLRERTEDIPMLVWRFLDEFSSRMGKKITQVSRATMEALQRHSWPGNVRELRNVIERGVIVATGDTLQVPLLGVPVAAEPSSETLADSERQHILRILERTGWRIKGPQGAAELLGLKPSTLYSRMGRLAIPSRHHRENPHP
jgi:PAS domain S-box-containing protein